MQWQVRTACEDDAERLHALRAQVEREGVMLFEPDEREAAAGRQRDELRDILGLPNGTVLLAESDDGMLGGYLIARGLPYRRVLHAAYLILGVRADWSGRGVGQALLQAAEAWADAAGVRRLELIVLTDNLRATSLYLRAGYQIEGVRRAATWLGDRYVDAYMMAKLSF